MAPTRLPIALASDYGVIGNQYSCALVSRAGAVEWCCFPFIDSPSHFGAYFEKSTGGRFQISPQGEFRSEQRYISNTQVLETIFETPMGNGILTDWMPMINLETGAPTLHRRVESIDGKIAWMMTCAPRFHYGRDVGQAEAHLGGILFRGKRLGDLGFLLSDVPIGMSINHSAALSRFTLDERGTAHFTWSWGRQIVPVPQDLGKTQEYWKTLAHRCASTNCIFGGPWHELVIRSGMIIQLMLTSYASSLAEGVAVSTADGVLPPMPNEVRKWDDRCTSIRNGAWNIQALANLGYTNEAQKHFHWIAEILERDGVEGLQPVYSLDGGKTLPVDQENEAWPSHSSARRFQLDIYGHVVIAANLYFKLFRKLPESIWPRLVELADYVCQAWKRPDHGPSGASARPEHFVVSKVFCWAALQQMCELATHLHETPSPKWLSEKEILHRTICEQGYDPTKNSFISSFGGRELDASTLWLPLLNFLPTDDPRIRGTIDRINLDLSAGVLLKRTSYSQETGMNEQIDLQSSFLFISCLALSGQVDEATDRMAELCTYSNELGLFGDQITLNSALSPAVNHTAFFPRCFPSSAVHLSLVNAALYIGWAKGRSPSVTHLMGQIEPKFRKTA